jgi:hypothetical protein
MKRYDFCNTCKICTRTCSPKAIMSNGIIDSPECMNCLDCQMNFWDRTSYAVRRAFFGVRRPTSDARRPLCALLYVCCCLLCHQTLTRRDLS